LTTRIKVQARREPLISALPTLVKSIMTLTAEQQAEVIEGYVNRVVDGMEVKEMEQLLYNLLLESFEHQSESEVKELICTIYGAEFYQELVSSATS